MGLYEPPEGDLDRDSITSAWNTSQIMDSLDEQYDDLEKEFGESREELKERVGSTLAHDEDEDWVDQQLPESQEEYEVENTTGIFMNEELEEHDDPLFPGFKTGFHRKNSPGKGIVYDPRA